MKTTSAWMFVALALAGCSDQPPPPGGGAHKINAILLLAREHGTLIEDKNPATLQVGESLGLRVMASWEIPYVGEVTDKAALSVSNPAVGQVNDQATFVAKAAGETFIEAELRVARGAGGDKVLAPSEPAGGDTVLSFKKRMKLTVRERPAGLPPPPP